MNKLTLLLLCKIYLILVLLAATIMSALPESLPALVLLLIMLATTLYPQPPRLNVAINAGVIFLTPLVLAPSLESMITLTPVAVHIIAVLLILPAFYLIDHNLRENARQTRISMNKKGGRHATYIFISLLAPALVVMLLSLVINSRVLLFTSITFTLYLLAVLTGVFLTIPRLPLTTTTATARVIAGTNGSFSMHIVNEAPVKLRSQFIPSDPWIKVTPPEVVLNSEKISLELSFTPPLAGNARPQLHISTIDLRGFIQINQSIEPVQLQVIPRARYAEWLARKYLEQTGTGVTTAATLTTRTIMMPQRGVDYTESRTYQPGDQLKDIDWKHTLKLSQLIVKEYIDTDEQAAIIAVNLSVTDAEEADKLAFNLIMAALTLARENIPTALAVYNHESAVLCTAIIDSSEIIKQALSLLREINPVEFTNRYLEPTDITKIRRNINQLKKAESKSAQQLLSILNFEHNSIEEAARSHPATIALSATARQVPAPATIILVSQLNHDAEAILVTTEKLSRRRFTTIPIGATKQSIPQ